MQRNVKRAMTFYLPGVKESSLANMANTEATRRSRPQPSLSDVGLERPMGLSRPQGPGAQGKSI